MKRADLEKLAVEKLGPGATVCKHSSSGEWVAERVANGKRHTVAAKDMATLDWVLRQLPSAGPKAEK